MKKMKGKNRIITKRFVITMLFIISFLMTSSTFAYWAGMVEGTDMDVTTSFVVGAPIFDNHEFVLNDKVDTYRYGLDIDMLLEDPEVNIQEVVFGIIWDDDDIDEDDKEDIINGEIEVEYEIIIMRNGKEVNKNKYKRYSKLINLDVSDDNPDVIEYNSTETFRFSVTLTEENKRNDYKNLAKYEVYIEISYEVDED